MISTEKINKNYKTWIALLKKYNCYSETLVEKYGELIKKASFSLNEDSGLCYEGSVIDVSVNRLASVAMSINDLIGDNSELGLQKVEKDSLIRVLLIQHISKCMILVEQTNDWKRKNGYLYDFNKNLNTSLKVGERSIFMCMECGIVLSEEEYEAIKIIDKDDEDKSIIFSSQLSNIIKMANDIVSFAGRKYYAKLNKAKKEVEE